MKCEHCGKNEATFYYKSNINGNVTEHHLCSDCARELGYADSMEKSFGSFGQGLFGGFDDFFAPMPALAGRFFGAFEEMKPEFLPACSPRLRPGETETGFRREKARRGQKSPRPVRGK
jgi:Uncharacterized protein with conserved CXXC pairs